MSKNKPEVMGTVLSIQYFSIHDGPGIRTTVFLKGCNMNCAWCHNAESIALKQELSYNSRKCISCRLCAQICPHVHQFNEDRHTINREFCTACGECVNACPSSALSVVGYKTTAEGIICEVLKDKRYYGKDGGLTVSGGEPTCQADFLKAILYKAKQNGIHTALETNGFFSSKKIDTIFADVDLILFDYKATDNAVHEKMTGVSNKHIVDNLERLSKIGVDIILRCPIIPGVNDNEKHFKSIADLTMKYDNMLGFEIMPYHGLGAGKPERIGKKAQEKFAVPAKAKIEDWKKEIRSYGGKAWRN